MTVGIEIYDTEGIILLSSESLVLNTGLKEVASATGNYEYWDNTGGTFDAQNLQHINYWDTKFINRKSWVGFANHTWFRPFDGHIVLTMGPDAYAVGNNSQFDIATLVMVDLFQKINI